VQTKRHSPLVECSELLRLATHLPPFTPTGFSSFAFSHAHAAVTVSVHPAVALQHGSGEFFAGHAAVAVGVEPLQHLAAATLTAAHTATIILIQATITVAIHATEHLASGRLSFGAGNDAVAISVRVWALHAPGTGAAILCQRRTCCTKHRCGNCRQNSLASYRHR
jgi:predicted RNA binding protein YcfA (HicA-like mRNA interferase family)